MLESTGQVRRNSPTKLDVSAHLALAWARVMARMGRGNFTDKMGIDRKVISRALGQETTPELHTALGSLLVDPTALDEVLALYGFGLHRLPTGDGAMIGPDAAQDAADFTAGVVRFQRSAGNHQETLRLAEKARPVAQAACGIVAAADRLRGAA